MIDRKRLEVYRAYSQAGRTLARNRACFERTKQKLEQMLKDDPYSVPAQIETLMCILEEIYEELPDPAKRPQSSAVN